MRKIKGFVPTGNCNILRSQEFLEKAVPSIGKYFGNTGNFLLDIGTPLENTMYVYSKMLEPLSECGQCNGKEVITVENNYSIDKRCHAIYEWMHLNKVNEKLKPSHGFWKVPRQLMHENPRLCPNSIKIVMDDCTIGEFCPAKNILMTSDWTDDEQSIPIVDDILSIMEGKDLLKRRKAEKFVPKVTYGADPEFVITTGPNLEEISARAHPIYMGGMIGKDGDSNGGDPREIRPKPSDTPEGLIRNIEEILEYPIDEIWSVRGEKYPIGGHIHLGGIPESDGFKKILDYFIGTPMMVLNSPHRGKDGSSYGRLGDMRKCPEHNGFEYRTPPSGWLGSKTLALMTLNLTKTLAEKHYAGEEIDIEGDIITDITNLGLDKRFALDYAREIEKLKDNLPRDIRKAWGIKTKPNPIIEFRDYWRDSTKKFVEDALKEHLKSLGKSTTITLYGLSKDRGIVFSVPIENRKVDLDYVDSIRDGIGVPYAIRDSTTTAREYIAAMKKLVE